MTLKGNQLGGFLERSKIPKNISSDQFLTTKASSNDNPSPSKEKSLKIALISENNEIDSAKSEDGDFKVLKKDSKTKCQMHKSLTPSKPSSTTTKFTFKSISQSSKYAVEKAISSHQNKRREKGFSI